MTDERVITKSDVERVIAEILIVDGPDGHIDGANVIAEYVMALLNDGDGGARWLSAYRERRRA